MTRSDKANTNAKWTSNDDYREGHARIFGYKVGQKLEAFLEGFGVVDVVVLERMGDKYRVETVGGEWEIEWDLFVVR